MNQNYIYLNYYRKVFDWPSFVKKISSILLCLAYYPRSTLGSRASSKTATSYWKSLSSRSKSFHFISLALSVTVPTRTLHHVIPSGRVWPCQRHLAGWTLTEMSLDYRLKIFWLKLNTSLARSFIHTSSQNTFSPSLLFF